MPAFPPPAALRAHRKLHHDARLGTRPGKVKIGNQSYDAEIYIAAAEYEPQPDGSGTIYVQRMTARILKTALHTAPPRQTVLTVDGIRFESGKVEGQMPVETAWIIHAHRLPKSS